MLENYSKPNPEKKTYHPNWDEISGLKTSSQTHKDSNF